jgi:hypothetical protein
MLCSTSLPLLCSLCEVPSAVIEDDGNEEFWGVEVQVSQDYLVLGRHPLKAKSGVRGGWQGESLD